MKTRQKILNAALKVLTENGFQALTQTRVAEAAGVGQGHLTYHFPTRSDLLTAVIDESKAQIANASAKNPQGPITLNTLKQVATQYALSSSFPRLMLALTVAADDEPSLSSWFAESDLKIRQAFRELLKEAGLDIEESELHLIRATVIGASLINLQQNTEASAQTARQVIDAAFERLLSKTTPL